MKIGVIADDFTGASDIALTIAEAGMTVAQFIGVPEDQASPQLGAGVVALKSRTEPVDQAVKSSLAACDWLLDQGVQQIIFKVCSTFDSTPKGNIGPVLDALSDRLSAGSVMVCPAFPETGRSVYQGHLFVNDEPLNESGMQNHPLTPMTDADLRRVLAAQSARKIGHIPARIVNQGPQDIIEALPEHGHVIVDAIHDTDLITIGRAAKNAKLLCGGSGIALGLPANFGASPSKPDWTPVIGPAVVLSGSCSTATRKQVEVFAKTNPAIEISVQAVIQKVTTAETVADWVLTQKRTPLIYSSADPSVVAAAQDEFGREASASAIEMFFSDLARRLADRGTKRIVVAGGETSGAAVKGLGVQVLNIGPRIAPGVPLVRVGERELALALKSGNFGDENFFQTALTLMESK